MEAVGKRFIVREDVQGISTWSIGGGAALSTSGVYPLDSTMSELQPTGRSGLYEPGWKSE